MIDDTPADPTPAKRGPLPPFLPVPRRHDRHDGWTPERQQGFIEGLADFGSVKAAAQAVGMSSEGAYQLRRHPEAGEFRKAWEKALQLGVRQLEDIAMERALHGVEVPVYHFGQIVGTRRVYNDKLLMFLLRNRAPKRFSADGGHRTDAATRGELRRLKAQWRKEWEREKALASQAEEQETLAEIDAMFARMRERRQLYMSPATREAQATFERLHREDRENHYNPFAEEAADDPDSEGENGGHVPGEDEREDATIRNIDAGSSDTEPHVTEPHDTGPSAGPSGGGNTTELPDEPAPAPSHRIFSLRSDEGLARPWP